MLFRSVGFAVPDPEAIVFLRVMMAVLSSETCSGTREGFSLRGGLAGVGLGILLSSRTVSKAVVITVKSISPSVKSIS